MLEVMPEDTIKNFDAVLAAKREAAGEGPAFILGGITFQCIPVRKAVDLADLIETATGSRVQPIIDYIRTLVATEQREAFDVEIHSDDNILDLETLQEIMAYLGEKYNALPTSPS